MEIAKNNLLEIEDLHVRYETEDGTIYAVNGLNLSLGPGESLGFVGETGAGKTTTAKAIMRILPNPPAKITSGKIEFDGVDILNLRERDMRKIRGRDMAMIFQDPMTSLNPVITVGEQIAEVIMLHQERRDRKEAFERAAQMLEMVGIKRERLSEYPHQFSGGMKQRVVIAMALACNPKLLIADEPTTALDVTIQAQVLELMKELKTKYNASMIMITHDLGIVSEICDKVAIMYAGNIVEEGTKEHIFLAPSHPYTQGLFSCIPDILSDENELVPIKGLVPDPSSLPAGCPFYPRCEKARAECEHWQPRNIELDKGHFVKCLLFEKDNKEEKQHG